MQLWERGLVDLDAPASEYLRAYRLRPAESRVPPGDAPAPVDPHVRDPRRARPVRPPPLRLGAVRGAASAAQRSVGEPLPTLAEYYRRRSPGRRPSRGRRSPTRTTASPRSARSSRTSADCRWTDTSGSTSSIRSAWIHSDLRRSPRVVGRSRPGMPSGAAGPSRFRTATGSGPGAEGSTPRRGHRPLRRLPARSRSGRPGARAAPSDARDDAQAAVAAGRARDGDGPRVLPRARSAGTAWPATKASCRGSTRSC